MQEIKEGAPTKIIDEYKSSSLRNIKYNQNLHNGFRVHIEREIGRFKNY